MPQYCQEFSLSSCCLQVGHSKQLKGRQRLTIKLHAGSRTGVSGLFRCADTPGGCVFLCLHAPRHCSVGVPAAFFLLCEDSFLVSLCILFVYVHSSSILIIDISTRGGAACV